MRLQKRKNSDISREVFITVLAKHRHYSTNPIVQQTPAKLAARQVVEMLLDEIFQAQKKTELYCERLFTFWDQLQMLNAHYLQHMHPQPKEVLNVLDQQPQPEQKKSKGVVGPQVLKKSLLKTARQREEISILEETIKQSIYDGDKKDRDLLIQKLKKEHVSILHTKYMSESLPIEQNRAYFKQKEVPAVEILRNSVSSSGMLKKLNKVVLKKKENLQSSKQKQKQLTTFYKKSKAYIDKIDPTNPAFQNQIYDSQNANSPRRGSIYRIDSNSLGSQDPIIIRESNFKQISNTVAPSKQILNQLGLKFIKQPVTLPTVQSGDRQQFSQRAVDRSLHMMPKQKKLTADSVKKQPRQKNSMSVCLLPKIKH